MLLSLGSYLHGPKETGFTAFVVEKYDPVGTVRRRAGALRRWLHEAVARVPHPVALARAGWQSVVDVLTHREERKDP